MSADLLLPAVFAATALVALGFHRHRLAQVALLMLLFALGLGSVDERWQEGALRFGPTLLLLSVLLPEGRLLSKRHLVWLGAVLLLIGTTLDAPYPLLHSMARAAAWPFDDHPPAQGAALWLGLAVAVCLLRWAWRGQVADLGLLLALAALALASISLGWRTQALSVAAALLLLTVLYGSYRMAFLDTLTGLPNRRALDETLGRLSGQYTLAMLDIDHFKSFNDTHGHDAGDVVLREVARDVARQAGGRAFRYGGEEFCVVYAGRSAAQAAEGLEAARQHIEQRRIDIPSPRRSGERKPRRKQVSVTISAGCATREGDRRSAMEVLKAADQALYRAKKKGRNQVMSG